MSKKILFVVTKSNFGGAQRYVYDLATALPTHLEPVVAFGAAPAAPGQLASMLAARGVRTIKIPALVRDVSIVQDWRAFRALYALFRKEAPSVVHLNSSKAGGLGALAARLAGVPRIIFTVHGLPADEDRSMFQRILIALLTWMTSFLSHATIAITNDALARLRRQPFLFRRVVLIHNGIPAIEFESPSDARKALRTIDPNIPDEKIIGTIAELHPNKDLTTAIDAIAGVDTHFVIIGDGEEREKLRSYAEEKGLQTRVHFLGFIPHAARYLRAFDVFLLSSVKEGLPYVLLEAASAQVPIVASDIPGVRDIVLHNFTGLAPRTPSALGAALETILENPALARSLTEEMAKRVRTSFSFEKMVEKTVGLYTLDTA